VMDDAGLPLQGRIVGVTGAAGFIGSYVCPRIVALGGRVVALAPELGWRPAIAELLAGEHAEWRQIDVLTASPPELSEALGGLDRLVHLAYAPPPPDTDALEHEMAHNLGGTERLMDACPANVEHVVFTSSVAVYGPSPGVPVREGDPCDATTPYGIAKRATERMLIERTDRSSWSLSILRLSTVYGATETVGRAIPNFIRSILAGRAPSIRGDGRELRDYLHVRDAARSVGAAVTLRDPAVLVCNLGTGTGTSTQELARLIAEMLGSTLEPRLQPSDRQPASIVCDTELATAHLAHEACIGLDEGLEDEIRWFADRPHLWAPDSREGESTS
jgi:nucleoside-diphosphate-sugar epimerase